MRCHLAAANQPTVIVKHVKWPTAQVHPRGWSTDRSHARKAKSYQVESVWYRDYASRCPPGCRVPRCLGLHHGDEVLMVMEDLDASGFNERHYTLTDGNLAACLQWLQSFMAPSWAKCLRVSGRLEHTGTCDPPDELALLQTRVPALANAAAPIDRRLSASPFQTIVHGDAKVANFCFSKDHATVAAVDFQYVGGGCGMKDVAYFMSSCLDETECEAREEELLSIYFAHRTVLTRTLPSIDAIALEADWRSLYPYAWADFFRFLEEWSRVIGKAMAILGASRNRS